MGDGVLAPPGAVQTPTKSLQIISAGSSGGISGAATNYVSLTSGYSNSFVQSTETGQQMIMPIPGTWSNLSQFRSGGTGSGWFSIQSRVSSSAGSQTMKAGNQQCAENSQGAPSSSISSCTDSTHTDAVAAGDFFDVQSCPDALASGGTCTPGGTAPATNTGYSVSAIFTSTNTNEIPFFGTTNAVAVNGDFAGFGNVTAQSATESTVNVAMPSGGVADKFVCAAASSVGASGSIDCTVYYETAGNCGTPSASSLATTIATNTSVAPFDNTHTITYGAGDCFSVKITTHAGTPTYSRIVFAMRLKPTNTGEAVYVSLAPAQNAGSGVTREYTAAGVQSSGGNSANNFNQFYLPPGGFTTLTVRDLYFVGDTSGTSRVFHMQNTTNTAGSFAGYANLSPDVACTQSGSATCSAPATNTATVSPGTFLRITAVNTGTPAAGTASRLAWGGVLN